MRVNEFITESLDEEILDEYSQMNPGIKDALIAKGYKFLGQGVDQAAYIEPGTGHILKIFGTQGNEDFSPDHQMFFRWAKFCEKHQDNKFLPRFYGHESFIWNSESPFSRGPARYLMIRTEPLHESGKLGKAMARLSTQIAYRGNVSEALNDLNSFYHDANHILNTHFTKMGEIHELAETMYSLYNLGKRHGWKWDLHDDNIMLRKDGTPVLNDPWVIGD
jgi:hypothetical protein